MSSPNTAGISKELLNGTAKESDSSKKEGHEKVPEGKTGTNSDAAMLDASKLEFMESIGEDVEDLEKKICQWRWHCIDGVRLPVILRDGNSRLASVNIVQTKLLSKFPQNIPLNIAEEHVMLSHKMTATEALTLNVLNSALSSYELGCQIFTTDDELVDIAPVEIFYWIVKKLHLNNLITIYRGALKKDNPANKLTALTIACLEQLVDDLTMELEKIDSEIRVLKGE